MDTIIDSHDQSPIQSQVASLQCRWNKLQKDKEDVAFYEDAVISHYLRTIRMFRFNHLPSTSEFYATLCDVKDKNHERNKCFLEDILKRYLCKDINITGFSCLGYSMYGVDVYLTRNNQKYGLVIPVNENITRSAIVHNGSINWSVGQLRLLSQTSEHCWTVVWEGYDIEDCNYFKESNPDIIPFD